MRIDSIGSDALRAIASQVSYLELRQLQGSVLSQSLQSNSGLRFLYEQRDTSAFPAELHRLLSMHNYKIKAIGALKPHDWEALVESLTPRQWLRAFMTISKEHLIRLLLRLDRKQLMKFLFQLLPLKHLLKRMPMREIMAMLRHTKLTVNDMMPAFQEMQPVFLQQLLEKALGQPLHGMTQGELLDILARQPKRVVLDAFTSLPYKAILPFMLTLTKKHPFMFERLSEHFLTRELMTFPQAQLVQAMQVLEGRDIWRLMQFLPASSWQGLANLVDASVLGQYLSAQPALADFMSQLSGMAA